MDKKIDEIKTQIDSQKEDLQDVVSDKKTSLKENCWKTAASKLSDWRKTEKVALDVGTKIEECFRMDVIYNAARLICSVWALVLEMLKFAGDGN